MLILYNYIGLTLKLLWTFSVYHTCSHTPFQKYPPHILPYWYSCLFSICLRSKTKICRVIPSNTQYCQCCVRIWNSRNLKAHSQVPRMPVWDQNPLKATPWKRSKALMASVWCMGHTIKLSIKRKKRVAVFKGKKINGKHIYTLC